MLLQGALIGAFIGLLGVIAMKIKNKNNDQKPGE
jgi:hypothetical protein